MAEPTPPLGDADKLRQQRLRSRNLALFCSLLAVCVLFFAITIVQLSKAGHL